MWHNHILYSVFSYIKHRTQSVHFVYDAFIIADVKRKPQMKQLNVFGPKALLITFCNRPINRFPNNSFSQPSQNLIVMKGRNVYN